jgi:hypothetical protein
VSSGDEAAESSVSDSAKAWAKTLGWGDDDIAAYSSDEQLMSSLRRESARLAKYGEALMAGNAPPQATTPTQGADPATSNDVPLDWEPDLDPDEYGPVVENMKSLRSAVAKQVDKQVKQLMQQVGQALAPVVRQAQAAQQQQAVKLASDVDSFFDGLGGEWADTFGQGRTANLPQNSPAALARQKLFRTAAAMNTALRGINGGAQPDVKQLLEQAMWSAFPEKSKEHYARQIAERRSKKDAQTLIEPRSKSKATGTSGEVQFKRDLMGIFGT